MSALKERVRLIADRLASMPPATRLLVASLAAVMVMALVLVAQYAGGVDREPLPIAPERLEAARTWLDGQRVGYRSDEAGRILVRPTDRATLVGRLQEAGVLDGEDIEIDQLYAADGDGSSIWMSENERRDRSRTRKMLALRRIIAGFEAIESAYVIIDTPDRLGPAGASFFPATASVRVTTTGDALPRRVAGSIARLVASSQTGMSPGGVTVTDQFGNAYSTDDSGAMAGGDVFDNERAIERDVKRTVQELLAAIPGVRVGVSAQVEASNTQSTEYKPGEIATAPIRTEAMTSQMTEAAPGGVPGVGSNVASNQGLSAGGGGGGSMREQESRDNLATYPELRIAKETRGGHPTKINVTVRVPRSYLVSVWRNDGNEGEPGVADVDAVATSEFASIRSAVEPLLDTATYQNSAKGEIAVTMYRDDVASDSMPLSAGSGGFSGLATTIGLGAEAGGGGLAASGLVRTLFLAGLGMASLVTMFLMVKKATNVQDLPTPEEVAGVPRALEGLEQPMVIAEENAAPLEGRELDEEALRQQQMLEQLNELVATESASAAMIVKRWMRASA